MEMSDDKQSVSGEVETESSQTEIEDKYHLERKIFVGNVGYRVGWKQLEEFFSKFGCVSNTHIVKDHLKHRPRGIAFVTFSTEAEADNALQASKEELFLDGRQLRVHRAEESRRTTFRKYESVPVLTADAEVSEVLSVTACVTTESSDLPGNTPTAGGFHFEDLDDEALLKMISFLSVKERILLERVSHRLRSVSLRSWSALRTLHFRNMFRRFGGVTDKILQSLLQRCGSSLEQLDLSASPRLLTDYSMDIIAHFCPRLTYLDASGVDITNKSLKNLSASCKKLKVILMQRCFHVGEKGLWWVLHQCKELERVDMEANSSITGKCFHMAGPKLTVVNLRGCSSLCDTGIFKLAELCPLIRELHLLSCFGLTDSAIETLGKSFPNMTVLSAIGCFLQTTVDSWTTLGHLTNLTELDLSMNVMISDSTLATIAKGCKKIRKLDISSCHRHVTDAGLIALADLPSLENLNISYLHVVSDEGVELLAVNGVLRRLTARACSGLTDNGLQTFARHCNKLIHVDLSGNMQITMATLSAFMMSVSEFTRRITLHLGGTSVALSDVTVPSNMEINLMDLSMNHLRSDRELLLPEPLEVEDENEELDEIHNFEGNIRPAGGEVGECPWLEDDLGQFDDLCEDFLDNDHEVNEELWHVS